MLNKEFSGEQTFRLRSILYSPIHMMFVEDLNHTMKKERLLQHIDDVIKACAIAKEYIEKEEFENGR